MLHDSVRVSRWKTTVDPATAVCFARHIVAGTSVVLPDDAPAGAHELDDHITACKVAGAEFVTVNQATYAHGLAEFTSAATASDFDYAVDLWRFTYGDETHAAVSVVSQTPHHRLPEYRTAGGRAFGNHLIAASQDVSRLAAYSATRHEHDANKPWAANIDMFLLDPGTLPQYGQWCLDAYDITHAVRVRTLRGPDLDNPCWARTELGRDINHDVAFPSGVVHGVYNFTRR